MTEQEAKDMVSEGMDSVDAADIQGEAIKSIEQDYGFGSVEEAESVLDMDLIVPSALPKMKLDRARLSAAGAASPISSLAKITIRRAMNFGSSPPSTIRAR